MNIIGGMYRGRIISMPKGIRIRPTSNKVREALFNILGERISGAVVLDLFAGSGSLGLEALSRGARRAVFVDNDSRCVSTIKKNIKGLGIEGDVRVIQLSAGQGIKKLHKGEAKFDLIFMDPPYFSEAKGGPSGRSDSIKKILINMGQYDILEKPALAVCEHHKKEVVPEEAGGLIRFRQSAYGDTTLSFYKRT